MPVEKIDSEGFHTIIRNQHIIFEFIIESYTKELDQIKDLIIYKEKQLNFLQKEI